MDSYLSLAAFSDVKPGLESLKSKGISSRSFQRQRKMLEAAVRSAGIADLLDTIIHVEEVKTTRSPPRSTTWAPPGTHEKVKIGLGSSRRILDTMAPPRGLRTFGSNAPPRTRRRNSGSGPTRCQGDHGSRPAASP